MRDRLIELLAQCDRENEVLTCFNERPRKRQTAEIIADHLLANGVVCPPCKVGDTVYEIQPIRKRVQAYEITTIKYNGHYWWFTWILKDRKGIYGNVDGFSSHQIGKTLFLTREEAERALKDGD
jgi:hypothetical protein